MTGAPEITLRALVMCFLLLAIPLATSRIFQLKIGKTIVVAAGRMTLQLFLAGLYLKYLFLWNSIFLNIAWFFVMLVVAMFTVVRSSELNFRIFALPSLLALTVSIISVVLYFNYFVIRIANIFEAKYFIVVGGMLLGNSLRGNIISITNFYSRIHQNEKRYLYRLACGAGLKEALIPYVIESLNSALRPILATMMTIGLVSIPGMMSGQMLGGSSPMEAIKYQITIMIAIFVSLNISTILTIFFTIKTSFDGFGNLKKGVFKTALK